MTTDKPDVPLDGWPPLDPECAPTDSQRVEQITSRWDHARHVDDDCGEVACEDMEFILRQLSEARQALEAAERAMRTRPDYDCRCQDCGAAHNLDTSIPSATWNAICENRPGITPGADGIGMPEVGMLCTLCIDERLGKAGIRCDEAEFYFVGTNLSGKLYTESHGEVARLEREVADLEQRGTGLDEALAQMSARYAHLCDVLVVRDSTWEIHLQAKHARDGWAKRGTR